MSITRVSRLSARATARNPEGVRVRSSGRGTSSWREDASNQQSSLDRSTHSPRIRLSTPSPAPARWLFPQRQRAAHRLARQLRRLTGDTITRLVERQKQTVVLGIGSAQLPRHHEAHILRPRGSVGHAKSGQTKAPLNQRTARRWGWAGSRGARGAPGGSASRALVSPAVSPQCSRAQCWRAR